MRIKHEIYREEIRYNGIVGTLFLPKGKIRSPVVITLGGSSGGINEFRAELLASHGLATLALAYFGCDGLPSRLEEIPLEYFEKTIHWLETHSAINPDQIGLLGVSRGAELSLLIGSFFSEKIKAIAAYVPSSVVYGSLINPTKSAWMYGGKPILPKAPFDASELFDFSLSSQDISLAPYFLKGMEDSAAFKNSAIPVEKLKCPLLLISGQDDQMWPSCLFASQIEERLKRENSRIACSHYTYAGAGHSIAPCVSQVTKGFVHSIPHLTFNFGGTPSADIKAKTDAWNRTLDFFLGAFP